jgi:hypothetical protein
MKIDGGCHCGRITYEATVNAEHVRICHCSDCQALSGSPYRTGVSANKAHFRILTGQPRVYVKTAQSGARRAQGFCGDCGTHLYACAEHDPQVFSIRTGTARQRDQLVPTKQIWCRSAQSWAVDLRPIEAIAEQAPPGGQ